MPIVPYEIYRLIHKLPIKLINPVALGILIVPLATHGGRAQAITSRACPIRWSAPDTLRGPGGLALYVDSPSIFQFGDSLAIVAGPTWASDKRGEIRLFPTGSSTSPDLAGVRTAFARQVRRLGEAELIPLPPGVPRMAYPRVGRSSDGALHLAWELARSRPDSEGPAQVWTATLRGQQWSTPRSLLRAEDLVKWELVSRIVQVGEHAYLAVPVQFREQLYLLSLGDSGWQTSAHRLPWHGYPQVVPIAGRRHSLGLVYVSPSNPSQNSALYVTRSDDGGLSWSTPVHVRTAPHGQPFAPQLLSTTTGQLDLVWFEEAADGGYTIRVAHSTAAGAEWRHGPTKRVQLKWPMMSATSDRNGRIHVAFLAPPKSPSAPRHLMLHDGQWSSSGPRPVSGTLFHPTLVTLASGDLLMFWGIEAPPGIGFPVTLYSVGTAQCPAIGLHRTSRSGVR